MTNRYTDEDLLHMDADMIRQEFDSSRPTVIYDGNLCYCRTCDGSWGPMIKPGGRFHRGAMICPHCAQRHRFRGIWTPKEASHV